MDRILIFSLLAMSFFLHISSSMKINELEEVNQITVDILKAHTETIRILAK